MLSTDKIVSCSSKGRKTKA
uniref:Uncharacterized protein n=1 Tax=Rhizophora mucronata TaxID=61149 RepID=A0A2P2QMZ1_RHIMU